MLNQPPHWQDSPYRSHADVINELLDPEEGVRILDIGCGAGKITRLLSKMGASVIGIDPGDRQLVRAQAAKRVGNEIYIKGIAEELPFDDQSADVVLFFNSFHHVPQSGFQAAIEEAHRVLRSAGKLYFAEPIADGPQFELSRLINDETEIRALAYDVIQSTPQIGFKSISEIIYITENRHKNFDSFRSSSTSINPARDALFAKHDLELRERFERLSSRNMGEYVFPLPVRGNLFEKS